MAVRRRDGPSRKGKARLEGAVGGMFAMLNNTRFGFVAAALFAFAAAQGCAVDDVEDTSDDGFRIINGAPASSTVPQYAATVGIHQRSGSQVSIDMFCTGTLIADDTVMTAAHCCDEAGYFAPNFNPMEPEEVAVYFGDGPAFVNNAPNGSFYAVTQLQVHPSYNRTQLHNDICLLRLSTSTTGVTPVPHLPASLGLSNADVGVSLDHAGFGYSDLALTEYGVKLHGALPLGGMGCTMPGCPAGQPTTTQFSYVQNNEGPCNGDSGGPAFLSRSGTIYAAGVTSYGDSACDQYGVSTNVAAFDEWINAFTGGGGGGGGGGGPTCGNATCEVGESCDGRNGTTSCISDCPGKLGGKTSSRFCYVDGACTGPGCP